MPTPLRVLIVEDSEDDARLLHRRLELGGYAVVSERVESESALRAALAARRWDLILCDYVLPGFGGPQALAIANELDLGLPFILVSGKIDEEIAVEVMKAGASDFVTKAHLERLLPAVRRELASAAAHRGLRRAELEWRTALDAVQDAVFIHDAGFRVVRANRAYAELAGMPMDEVVGKRYWEVFPKGEGPLPGCADGREAGAPAEDAFALPGGERYTSRSYPIADATGKYLYSVHVLLDVTERDRVREAVERSERRFRALMEHTSDLVVVCDARGTITYASPSVTRLAGYEVSEVVGRNVLEFVDPGEAAAATARLAEIVRHPERPLVTEFRIRRKDGSWVTLESIGRNALADPLLGGLVIGARDVTERRRAERALKLFRELIDRSSDAVEVVDPETLRYLDVNEAACQMLGYSRDELLSKRVTDIEVDLGPSTIESIERKLREAGSAEFESLHRRKDGSRYPVEVHVKRVQMERPYNVVSVRDVTERKQAQTALEGSARHFRKLIEGGADVFFVIDSSGSITYRSPAGEQLTGWSDEEVLGKSITDHVTPEYLPKARQALAEAFRDSGKPIEVELQLRRKDGALRDIEVTGRNLFADPDVHGLVVTVRDITERKRAEQAILDSEAKFRGVVDQSLVAITIFQGDRYLYANPRALEMFGYGADEFLRLIPIALVAEPDRPRVVESMRLREDGQVPSVHYTFQGRRKDGVLIDVEIHGTSMMLAGKMALTAVMMDVTESRRAHRRVEESEAKLSAILEAIFDGVAVVDPGTRRLLSGNTAFCEMLGYRADEIPALGIEDLHPRESVASVLAQFERQISGEIRVAADLPIRRKDGSVFLADVTTTAAQIGGKAQMVGVFHDVTERKRAEEELRRVNWALRALSRSNSLLVHAASEEELLRSCCEAIASTEGYALAWIGTARDDHEHSVEIVAVAGEAPGYMEGFEVSWADTPLGRGPTGTAIRSGATQIINDLMTSPAFLPWRERARASGLASSISLPIRLDHGIFGVLEVYSRERGAFGDDELQLLNEMAGDISYGIGTRRTRAAYEAGILERARQAQTLRATFESAIGALAATVEQRDPYTAGHQRRVAELAVAIGRELALDDERLAGLRIASTIHDIGKIYVPAEILARPGRLSEVEFEIVKSHAQVGYDIVKGVDFPWPVARTILQHHERLDGSGYPQGLRGEQIILEARILAVADVVEAMSSHRPYRPGLGLEAALDTIGRQAGRTLDADAVAACSRLFLEKGYRLAG